MSRLQFFGQLFTLGLILLGVFYTRDMNDPTHLVNFWCTILAGGWTMIHMLRIVLDPGPPRGVFFLVFWGIVAFSATAIIPGMFVVITTVAVLILVWFIYGYFRVRRGWATETS